MHPAMYITLEEGGDWIETFPDRIAQQNWTALKMEDWIYDRMLVLHGENPWRQSGNMRPSLNKPDFFVAKLFAPYL